MTLPRLHLPSLLVGFFLGLLLMVVVLSLPANRSHPVSTPAPSREETEKAEMERREEAVRQEETRRQEAERQRRQALERELQAARERQRAIDQRRAVVKTCVAVVREPNRSFSRFDAYVAGTYGDEYRYFGTADERFQFEKCMAERGVVLDKPTKP
jgi:hypothetical protein